MIYLVPTEENNQNWHFGILCIPPSLSELFSSLANFYSLSNELLICISVLVFNFILEVTFLHRQRESEFVFYTLSEFRQRPLTKNPLDSNNFNPKQQPKYFTY